MVRLILRLFVCALTFVLGISIVTLVRLFNARPISPTQTSEPIIPGAPLTLIPNGWKKIDLGDFSLFAPANMEEVHLQGKNINIWEFQDRNIILLIDYPRSATDPRIYSKDYDYQEEWIPIDGEMAKLVTFQASRFSFDEDRRYIAYAYFPHVRGHEGAKVVFWAKCNDSAGQETTKKMLLTIKYK